jgi:hypothetical protein
VPVAEVEQGRVEGRGQGGGTRRCVVLAPPQRSRLPGKQTSHAGAGRDERWVRRSREKMRARCVAGAPGRRDAARAAGPHCRIQEGGRAARDPSGLLRLPSAGKQHAKIRRRPPRAKIRRSMRAADRSCRGGRGPRTRPKLQGREPWGRGAARERERSGAGAREERRQPGGRPPRLLHRPGVEWGEREGVWWQWQETGPGSKKREVDKQVPLLVGWNGGEI